MTYTINRSSTPYQILTLANVNTQTTQTDNASKNVTPSTSSANSNNDSLMQSVIQSLQNLGVNTADVNAGNTSPNTHDALQVFVQNLSKTLTQSNPQALTSAASVENSTQISGGTNFKYNVDLSQANLGNNLANVSGSIKTALDNIGQYISSKVVFDLKVLTESIDSGTLAQANASLITTTTANPTDPTNPTKTTDASFIADSIKGVDSSPNAPDSTLYINLANMDKMSFSGTPAPDKYDLTTILTHEILHGLAFTGNLAQSASLKTAYDTLVTLPNDPTVVTPSTDPTVVTPPADPTVVTPSTDPTVVTPPSNSPVFFVGRHAETVNAGKPVPLAPASAGVGSAYYHVLNPTDLMSASINTGEVKSISTLDVAMLEDMGLSVTGVSVPPSKIQTAYNNPTANLQNLTNSLSGSNGKNSALQTDFTNLVQSLGGSTSPVNLQDFLTQLSANTANGNSLQPGSGSLFSAAA